MESKILGNDEKNIVSQFSYKEFIFQCLRNWPWILASVVIFGLIGVFYALKQPNKYEKTTSVLIKDQEAGSSAGEASQVFANMGLLSSNTNVNNELIAFTSPAVMYEAVKRLGLDVNYTTKGRFHDQTLYGTTLPVIFSFPGISENALVSLNALVMPDGSITLSDFIKYKDGEKIEISKAIKTNINSPRINTPLGEIMLRPNLIYKNHFANNKDGVSIKVTHLGMENATNIYKSAVTGSLHSQDADVIDLKAVTVSKEIDTDLLNTIIEVYNENWIEDKNRVALSTSQFINDRLKMIEAELGKVDEDISQYKSTHLVPDINIAADIYMKQSTKAGENILDLSNKLSMAKYVRDYLKDPKNANSVIPVNTGVGDMKIESFIATYNELLLERNNLLQNSSPANPIVKDYDMKITGIRHSVESAIDNQIVALSKSLGFAQNEKNSQLGKIEATPQQEHDLLSVERQQKVKESLYLYLLQKREENEITQAFTAYNTRIITPPTGPSSPVSPKRAKIVLIFLAVGLSIPLLTLYILQITNTKVKTKKDLEDLQMPFIGELPALEKSSLKKRLSPNQKNTKIELKIKPGLRDSINEAFKLVRSNLDFMTKKDNDKGEVIMTTSFNPSSGKSFFSLNMSASYALRGKKVLLIDTDLRHGSVSEFLNNPSNGITNYLSGETNDWEKYLKKIDDYDNLYILPIGIKPPNPLELIESPRFSELIKEARDKFDYILLDCPPYDIVADTQTISRHVDSTVFVIRAGIFDKGMISDISDMYFSNKYPKMRLLLNDVKAHSGRGYYYYKYHNYYSYRNYLK